MADEIQAWPLNDILAKHPSVRSIPASAVLLAATIILNVPTIQRDILHGILLKSQLKICADGGSNVLYDAHPSFRNTETFVLPDVIIGDLDSIRDDVRSFYESQNVDIVLLDDQDSTDLDKALAYTARNLSHSGLVAIVGTIGSHEGRIDQLFAVINAMYKYRNSDLKPVQVGHESVLLILTEGKHKIEVPEMSIHRHCGLIPLFGPVREMTTDGLEWNLSPSMGELSFGTLVSANNIVRSTTIEVETSDPVLFTMTYR